MLFNGRTLIFTFSRTQVRIAEIERLQSLFKTSMSQRYSVAYFPPPLPPWRGKASLGFLHFCCTSRCGCARPPTFLSRLLLNYFQKTELCRNPFTNDYLSTARDQEAYHCCKGINMASSAVEWPVKHPTPLFTLHSDYRPSKLHIFIICNGQDFYMLWKGTTVQKLYLVNT